MQQIKLCVDSIADCTLPNPSISSVLPVLSGLENTLAVLTNALLLDKEPHLYPCTPSELTLCVTDFTSLLTILVSQLARLGTRLNAARGSTVGKPEETVFCELWDTLSYTCGTLDTVANMRPKSGSRTINQYASPCTPLSTLSSHFFCQ